MNCSGCGSRLSDDATICELCGTPVDPDGYVPLDFEDIVVPDDGLESQDATESPSSDEEGVHCNQCGWKNPSGSVYCSQCGSKIQEMVVPPTAQSAAPSASLSVPQKKKKGLRPPKAVSVAPEKTTSFSGAVEPGAGKRLGIIIGAAVLVVFAVYMLFNLGGGSGGQTTSLEPGVPNEPPLPVEFAQRETELRQELANLTGELRIDKQRELLTLYFTSGRLDLAGAQAERIGIATGDESAWIDAGNFYYDSMESSAPEFKAYYSKKATGAYRKVLEINPDNLDVRTDMAVAYLHDPEQSMLAIQETALVLEADSNHIQANFNRGIMLWQINRIPEAAGQFEKVMQLVDDPENVLYQRARDALESLRQDNPGS